MPFNAGWDNVAIAAIAKHVAPSASVKPVYIAPFASSDRLLHRVPQQEISSQRDLQMDTGMITGMDTGMITGMNTFDVPFDDVDPDVAALTSRLIDHSHIVNYIADDFWKFFAKSVVDVPSDEFPTIFQTILMPREEYRRSVEEATPLSKRTKSPRQTRTSNTQSSIPPSPSQSTSNTQSSIPPSPSQSTSNTQSSIPPSPSQSTSNTQSSIPPSPSQSTSNTQSSIPPSPRQSTTSNTQSSIPPLGSLKDQESVATDQGCIPPPRCLPPLGSLKDEAQVAKYLNQIVLLFADHLKRGDVDSGALGTWTASFANKRVGTGSRSKPDITLVPKGKAESELMWQDIMSVGEKTRIQYNTSSVRGSSLHRAYMMLYTQADRNQATTFSMDGKHFYVYIVDREGINRIGPMDYQEHTVQFLTLILKLSFIRHGFDQTMIRHVPLYPPTSATHPPPSGADPSTVSGSPLPPSSLLLADFEPPPVQTPVTQTPVAPLQPPVSPRQSPKRKRAEPPATAPPPCHIKSISCNGEWYTVVREIFCAQTLHGRATRVWEAVDKDGHHVIIKESWILQGRKESEACIIKDLDAPQIPKIKGHMTAASSTASHRPTLEEGAPKTPSKHREKRRVVETPVGAPLCTVSSYLELLGVFLDFAIGMFDLVHLRGPLFYSVTKVSNICETTIVCIAIYLQTI
ncbi:hypothetical protein H0H92_000437 [Tricholoma furcatifolium]|nr:hypothetical protein H0H92_000437 [Tricholoma furcatifolium]